MYLEDVHTVNISEIPKLFYTFILHSFLSTLLSGVVFRLPEETLHLRKAGRLSQLLYLCSAGRDTIRGWDVPEASGAALKTGYHLLPRQACTRGVSLQQSGRRRGNGLARKVVSCWEVPELQTTQVSSSLKSLMSPYPGKFPLSAPGDDAQKAVAGNWDGRSYELLHR